MRNVFGLEALQALHPRCYQRWSLAEDDQLRLELAELADVKVILANHMRTPSAILERIAKLGIDVPPAFKKKIRIAQAKTWDQLSGEESQAEQITGEKN
jgi:hypothetical protein